MRPHQGRVEGEENLPRPAGHTPLDAPQETTGLLGNQDTLLAHGQLVAAAQDGPGMVVAGISAWLGSGVNH